MPRLFIRVELHGLTTDISYGTYQQLHTFMEKKNWFRSLDARLANGSTVSRNLPTATYTGITSTASLDLAAALSKEIGSSVWYRNTVLVMTTADSWAIAGEEM